MGGPTEEGTVARSVTVSLVIVLTAVVAAAQTPIFEADFDDGVPGPWSAVAGPPATSFRVADLDLRDPHVYVDLIGCHDVTDEPFIAVPAVNLELAAALTEDGDGDGFIDLSPLLRFRPLADPADGLILELAQGDCTTPTDCVVATDVPPTWSAYDRDGSDPCLTAEAGTTSGYTPAVPTPVAPCWTSRQVSAVLDLHGTEVPLEQSRLATTLLEGPPRGMVQGLLRGFLAESTADAILIDLGVGAIPLSALLPGGTGNCASHDDRDQLEGVSGWWFYLELAADEITLPDQ